jgi:hypothetical protein
VRNVSYGDELFLLTLVLRELEQGVRLELESTRFIDRLQADIAFLDEALGDYQKTLSGNPHLPGKMEYLRRLCRLQTDFSAFLGNLSRSTSAIGKAFAPLRDALLAMERKQADLARTGRRLMSEAGEQRTQELHGISDEEFRILLSPDEPGEQGRRAGG